MSMDSAVIQSMGHAFMLWPSLLVTLFLLLPLSAACNWLKRSVVFDWPPHEQAHENQHQYMVQAKAA
jgi:hypothetical protein